MRAPTSRAWFGIRLSFLDVSWAFASPIVALLIRDTTIFTGDRVSAVPLYVAVSTALSLVFFWAFRIRDALPSYFSVRDALEIVKAGASTAIATCVLVFALTRLEGIPRSTPIIHGLVLISGLLAARAGGRLLFVNQTVVATKPHLGTEHILMIGANHITASFIGLIQACSATATRVVGILDDATNLQGRLVSRVRVVGRLSNLEGVLDEFKVHGVDVDRVLVGGGPDLLTDATRDKLEHVCEQRGIALEFVPQVAGLRVLPGESADASSPVPDFTRGAANDDSGEPADGKGRDLLGAAPQPVYRAIKRATDLSVSAVALVLLCPALAFIALAVLIDVGAPVLFWQQRMGRGGQNFLVYKFRTLRAPYDRTGRRRSDAERMSSFGKLLRRTHCDELPQLLNVLVGDMSLVGPRPLLPVDQPPDPTIRLSVRPGVTGWAQLNGGNTISPARKTALDEWYVKNLSIRLDLYILALTALTLGRGSSHETWARDAASNEHRVGVERR